MMWNFIVGAVVLGVLPLSARSRAAIATAVVLNTSLALLTAYYRFTDPAHAASLPGADAVVITLWWRSCPLFLAGLAASRVAARLLRPCAALVEVIEEHALATARLASPTYQMVPQDRQAEGAEEADGASPRPLRTGKVEEQGHGDGDGRWARLLASDPPSADAVAVAAAAEAEATVRAAKARWAGQASASA